MTKSLEALISDTKADIAKRQAMPEIGVSLDGNIQRLKTINETMPSFSLENVDALIAALEQSQQLNAEPAIDSDVIRDANRYRFLRDEDAWGEDSDSWDYNTRTGLISWENLCDVRTGDFDHAIDARMAASHIPFLNPLCVNPDAMREVAPLCVKLPRTFGLESLDQVRLLNYADTVAAIRAAGGELTNE